MDTSETYIKMCDCEEIQGQRPKSDIPWSTGIEIDDDANFFYNKPISVVYGGESSRLLVWLPRQDQLQEMVPRKDVLTLIEDFYEWTDPWLNTGQPYGSILRAIQKEEEYIKQFTSMEQLWLAFVMKGYNKVWDGEVWC